MKIATFGMMNNPEYRQEPWRESIAQKLQCFDYVCIVCGNAGDLGMLLDAFPDEWENGRLQARYKEWPFPEWSYEQFPAHLNEALQMARNTGARWGMRLDIDTMPHEKDMPLLREAIGQADRDGKWVALIQKMQFFKPTLYYEKGKMPLVIKLDAPVAYGMDKTRYTDLCQPILWDGKTLAMVDNVQYDFPIGTKIPDEKTYQISKIKVFNYDHTFRTEDRARELLYQIEKAHERFWKQGYTGKHGEEITRHTSMQDFLDLSIGRYGRMKLPMEIKDHPKHIQPALYALDYPQWGFDLWGKTVI